MQHESVKISRGNWHMALAHAIEDSAVGATIEVHSPAMLELARRAAVRMQRPDLSFVLEDTTDAT